MSTLKDRMAKGIHALIDRAMGNGLMQEEVTAEGTRYVTPGIAALIRQAGAESCVLLKNDGMLPLDPEEETAVFGRCQADWFYVGYGSGGDVNPPYRVNLLEGLEEAGVRLYAPVREAVTAWASREENRPDDGYWGHWPMSYPEMPLSENLVREAAAACRKALVVIGRAAGEDRENTLTKGSYYLTDEETAMLDLVTAHFRQTAVILNDGSVLDMSWTERYGDRLSAILYVWQGGMESGHAAADVLTGRVNPAGRLADTIAKRYEEYPSSGNFGGLAHNDYAEGIYVGYRHFDRHPETVLYPFGSGLSYTTFDVQPESLARADGQVTAQVAVTNTGSRPGHHAVLLWAYPPAGYLDKPLRVLAAFGRTGCLAPGESETLTLSCEDKTLASFDERTHRFVLDAGEYRFAADEGRPERSR